MNDSGSLLTLASRPGSVGVRVRVPSAPPGVLLHSVGAPAPCARPRRLASRSRGPQPEPQRDLDSYGRSRMSPDAAPLATWVDGTQANVHRREEVVWGIRRHLGLPRVRLTPCL